MAPLGSRVKSGKIWVFHFLSLKEAYVPNLSLSLCLEPVEKFMVVGGGGWVVLVVVVVDLGGQTRRYPILAS